MRTSIKIIYEVLDDYNNNNNMMMTDEKIYVANKKN